MDNTRNSPEYKFLQYLVEKPEGATSVEEVMKAKKIDEHNAHKEFQLAKDRGYVRYKTGTGFEITENGKIRFSDMYEIVKTQDRIAKVERKTLALAWVTFFSTLAGIAIAYFQYITSNEQTEYMSKQLQLDSTLLIEQLKSDSTESGHQTTITNTVHVVIDSGNIDVDSLPPRHKDVK